MQEGSTPRKIFTPLIIAPIGVVVLVVALFVVTWLPLRRARDSWRANQIPEAISTAEAWSRVHLWSRQYHQMLAATYLSIGDTQNAQPHLDALRSGRTWLSLLQKSEVANRLFARARYAEFLAYDTAVHGRDDDDVPLYRAAAQLAMNHAAEAEATAKDIDEDDVDAKKLAAFRAALEQRKQGSYPFVIDRKGRTIAAYQFANADVVAINTDFAALVDRSAGAYTIEAQSIKLANDTIETTLDADIQKAAMQALAGFRGSLVAIDVHTNELLAIASSPGRGPLANSAIEQQYEPGAIVKVLTTLNALENGVNVDAMFPYTCNGALAIDGRQLGDSLPQGHGVLPDLDEALAESCDIVFADIGLRLGRDRLKQFTNRARFDMGVNLGLYQVMLGKNLGAPFNNYETAAYAIGKHQTTTTLHLATLAWMLANRGVFQAPQLLRVRRSILGEGIALGSIGARDQFVRQATAERVARAMQAVVTRERGTGRRAAIEGTSLALITGDRAILGFTPQIAFALFVEDAGPAEIAGAKVAHDFLAAVAPIIGRR
ncbi:MAG TPA: penicillin-binding transpeptidase domain-containing protein [Thermoanaerobaculia bacterium]|nr:penicillin-binding transpeptidase domain-containing protein [Thermoanaerobaculia bacterium]